MTKMSIDYTCVELCAGAGGQAIGIDRAGFKAVALVDNDPACCKTLRCNRPDWNVIECDLRQFTGKACQGVDLVCAGVPCPPFSIAGKQLGENDERNLFPDALRIVSEISPRGVLFENVPGLADPKFSGTLNGILISLNQQGYMPVWKILNARDYGTPQLRPRLIIAGLLPDIFAHFMWPEIGPSAKTVGETLYHEMSKRGWRDAKRWADHASMIAPTLVGGSKKHGGPDLGPTRARLAWAKLGVDGLGLANEPPAPDFTGMPRLTVQMAALIQGFPHDWQFHGGKTQAYRQIGNAFPPQVSYAVGKQIRAAIEAFLSGAKPAACIKPEIIATQEVFAFG